MRPAHGGRARPRGPLGERHENNPAWRLSESSRAAAEESYEQLLCLVRAARAAGFGSQYSIEELVVIWDAMCSGLALRENCGGTDPAQAEQIWRDSLGAMVKGLSQTK